MRPARVGLVAIAALAVAGARPAILHAQAAGVLLRLDPGGAESPLGRFDTLAVRESEVVFDAPGGAAAARVYEPARVARAPGLVMVHGVHRLGMNEPRLVRFARSVASTGITVFTPDVRPLADYTVDAGGVAVIGASARALRARLPGSPAVGLMGLSFAGGLALLAAGDARFADDVAYVVAVGADDDLPRVATYFATGSIDGPDGAARPERPHEYGALVLVYAHAEDFFPPPDEPVARDALRAWLAEDRDGARARAAALPAASRDKLAALFEGRIAAIGPELLRDVAVRRAELEEVSPHGHLAGVRVPVFLLHGAKDSVIPASETLWIARDLPVDTPRSVLVSNLIGHVELEGAPAWGDRWAAVHFFAGVLQAARGP